MEPRRLAALVAVLVVSLAASYNVPFSPRAAGGSSLTFIGSASSSGSGANCGVTVTPNPSTTTGDLLVAHYQSDGQRDVSNIAGDTGFTQIHHCDGTAGDDCADPSGTTSWVGWRTKDASSNYTFANNDATSENCRASILTFRNQNASPIQNSAGVEVYTTDASPAYAGTIASGGTNPYVVVFLGVDFRAITASAGGSWTTTVEDSSGGSADVSIAAVYQQADTVTNPSWTIAATDASHMVHVKITE